MAQAITLGKSLHPMIVDDTIWFKLARNYGAEVDEKLQVEEEEERRRKFEGLLKDYKVDLQELERMCNDRTKPIKTICDFILDKFKPEPEVP